MAETRSELASDNRAMTIRRAGQAAVGTALLVLALALAATVAPRLLGYHSFAITTGSMGSAAPRGSLVIARAKPPAAVRPGDVIVIERPGRSRVIHRVVSIDTASGAYVATTRGDANTDPDPEPYPLPPQVATETVTLPFLGYLVALLALPIGWLLLIALPASAVGFSFIRDLWTDGERAEPAPSAADAPPSLLAEARAAELNAELVAMRAELAFERERVARTEASLARQSAELIHERERLARAEAMLVQQATEIAHVWQRLAAAEESIAAQAAQATPEPLAEQAPEPPAPPADEPLVHLLFVPTADGYVLHELPGAAPAEGTLFEGSDGQRFVVSKVGRSPLPGDARTCAYLQAAPAPS